MSKRLLTEEVEKVIDNAKMADIVDGRFSAEPYAKEVISIILKAVGDWLKKKPKSISAPVYGNPEVLWNEVEALLRGEMPE